MLFWPVPSTSTLETRVSSKEWGEPSWRVAWSALLLMLRLVSMRAETDDRPGWARLQYLLAYMRTELGKEPGWSIWLFSLVQSWAKIRVGKFGFATASVGKYWDRMKVLLSSTTEQYNNLDEKMKKKKEKKVDNFACPMSNIVDIQMVFCSKTKQTNKKKILLPLIPEHSVQAKKLNKIDRTNRNNSNGLRCPVLDWHPFNCDIVQWVVTDPGFRMCS